MKIRIGKDINIRWEILTDGEPRPLEGRTLALYIQDYTRRRTEIPFTRDGNALLVSLRAAQLTRLGEYVLTLIENEDEEGQTAVDAKPAFTLVEYTTEEDDSPAAPELDVEQVRLETANLVRTAGGIQPEELFAGKPVVMEKGDIVPVMRDGELRPVRVPGTLNGKFRGVIHKAVPIYPRAGMAYVFRDKNLFVHVPDDLSKLYENLSILCKKFNGIINDDYIRHCVVFYRNGVGSLVYRYAGKLIDKPDQAVSLLFVLIRTLIHSDASAIFILSDCVSIYSPDFRFKFVEYLNDNVEMVSPHYAIQSGRAVFTALPYFRIINSVPLIPKTSELLREKKTKRILEGGIWTYVHRRGFWSRFLLVDREGKPNRIKKYLPYRMMRYETSFNSAKNPICIDIRGEYLIQRGFKL